MLVRLHCWVDLAVLPFDGCEWIQVEDWSQESPVYCTRENSVARTVIDRGSVGLFADPVGSAVDAAAEHDLAADKSRTATAVKRMNEPTWVWPGCTTDSEQRRPDCKLAVENRWRSWRHCSYADFWDSMDASGV